MRSIPLDSPHQDWELKGYWPWVPIGQGPETLKDPKGVTQWLPATVPGGVHADLLRAGLIEDPYVDTASLAAEWVEHRWWLYRTRTDVPAEARAANRVELACEGLDYETHVYVNGTYLGTHANMYVPAVFDVTELLAGADALEVRLLFCGAPDEQGQVGRTSLTRTQKARFGYKWDFCARLVNIGPWQGVSLRCHEEASLTDVWVRTDFDGERGVVRAACEADGGDDVLLELLDPAGEPVASAELAPGREHAFTVDAPHLWWPNGHGEQPLYTVRAALRAGGRVVDEVTRRVGIRSLRVEPNPGAPEGALPYTYVVNGERVLACGANITPLDLLYGTVDRERTAVLVRRLVDMNATMVRVWGGGLIETDAFYDLCDEHGLLVFQDFIQSSSGIDNVPAEDPAFLEQLEATARAAVLARRSHTSLAVWCGGNELTDERYTPITVEHPNIALLQRVVRELDPDRHFVASSGSGPLAFIDDARLGWDVHGHWEWVGHPRHYELYGGARHLFHGEFGIDGASDAQSIRECMSERHQQPARMADSPTWRHHGEWWGTYERDEELFGARAVADLDAFSACSQFVQAEGLRFQVEADRRLEPLLGGTLVWQLNECYPNACCTALVDYYGRPKLAWHAVRNAFRPSHVSLDYRSLSVTGPDRHVVQVHAHGAPHAGPVAVEAYDARGARLAAATFDDTGGDPTRSLGTFEVPLDGEVDGELVLVRAAGNDYVFTTRTEQPLLEPLLDLRPELDVSIGPWQPAVGLAGELRCSAVVCNTGPDVAVALRAQLDGAGWHLDFPAGWRCLLPGERWEGELRAWPEPALPAGTSRRAAPTGEPQVRILAGLAPAPALAR